MAPTVPLANSIDEVIEKLKAIIEASIRNNDRAGFFAALYYKVTVKVKEGATSGQFGDGVNICKLDVHFANRYFYALEQWQQGQPITNSWKVAFEATKKGSYLILQQLLLGMNAHINLDLGIATYEISNGDLNSYRTDYNNINLILSSLTYGVISQLNTLSPLMSFLGFSGRGSESMLIQFSMGNARDGSWCFAEELAQQPKTTYNQYIQQRDQSIFELGESLIKSKGFLRFGIWLIHLFEVKKADKIIHVLYEYQKPYKKDLQSSK